MKTKPGKTLCEVFAAEHDRHVIEAMLAHGSHFHRALAQAAQLADSDNLARIKEAWPNIWNQYSTLAKRS